MLARRVLQVKNITDVGHLRDDQFDRGEDKMLVAAHMDQKSPEEIARFCEATFHEDERAANILPAHVIPRATDHIPQMVAMTEPLAVVRDSLKDGSLPAADRRWLLLEADRVLGPDLGREIERGATLGEDGSKRVCQAGAGPLPEGATEMLRERGDARAARDFARSDALRAALAALGVEVVDGPGGTQEWRIRDR